MARTRPALPVKLFVGLLGGDVDLLRRARQLLTRRFGPTDIESETWPFVDTNYYEDEMGTGLNRKFLAFERLIAPDALAGIKCETNELECAIADASLANVPRPVNIDPGYVELGKLVLATTKDRAHRIYLGARIYAEVTLTYRDNAWLPSEWTYPDFRRPEYHAYFLAVRARLKEQREALGGATLFPNSSV